MIMTSSLLKNIHLHVNKLKEQAAPAPTEPNPVPADAPPAPPAPTPAAPVAADPNAAAVPPPAPDAAIADPSAAGAPAADMSGEPPADAEAAPTEEPPADDAVEEEPAEDESPVPEGQPPVDKEDPIKAVFDYGLEIAKQTIDPETILKAIKSSIQSNFNGNYEAAWAVVQRLKDTENAILNDVANRLSLFISGTIQENKNKGSKVMRVSKEEIRQLVREAVKANVSQPKKAKEVSLTNEQFERVIRNTVARRIAEGAIFDKRRSMISQERSTIENQLVSTDIREMAIDLFEKICQKAGLDADSLTPEAMAFVEAELDRMITSAQEISNKLIQVATVVKTAAGGAAKSQEDKG
jgi:hypothetical protein